ncbi:MAG: SMI1/KNR4 family protein [Chryseobacterium sp.]|jgi:hypothetical protein|uniref:SMI1/KNR4 family protein n=1 Tax=Chryseobacterium sp. TaxID=1871047 RepID=UPI002821749C|nr:SMI1/KNR4 family protein [Chryseobacterium sp.]MDR2235272.1 SMI1/KNR4 family protein [Chryseobacterium sp.]
MNPLAEHPDFIFESLPNENLSEEFLKRYPKIPEDYLTFLKSFSLLTNLSDTTWFNSIADFNGTHSESEFRWNEFEQQSLEAFEGDEASQQQVSDFWASHLPIILSVKNGYAYFSIGTAEGHFGKIYFGEEPEYEEAECIANSFSEFIKALQEQTLKERLLDLF